MKKSLAAICLSLSTLSCAGEDPALMQTPEYGPEVINGMKGDHKEFGSIVAIATPENRAYCTGTLIRQDLVLTAAHCLTFLSLSYFDIIYGVNDLSENVGVERKGVVKSIHPYYFPKGENYYDMALILLDTEIKEAVTAKILPPRLYGPELKAGREIIITGYGESSDLDHPNGVLYYGKVSIVSHDGLDMLLDGESADACFGDSGGPSYLWSGREMYLTGVTSHLPPGKEQCGDGAVVGLPGSYLDWIDEEYGRMKEDAKMMPVIIDKGTEVKGVKEYGEEGCNASGKNGKDWLPFLLPFLAERRRNKR